MTWIPAVYSTTIAMLAAVVQVESAASCYQVGVADGVTPSSVDVRVWRIVAGTGSAIVIVQGYCASSAVEV